MKQQETTKNITYLKARPRHYAKVMDNDLALWQTQSWKPKKNLKKNIPCTIHLLKNSRKFNKKGRNTSTSIVLYGVLVGVMLRVADEGVEHTRDQEHPEASGNPAGCFFALMQTISNGIVKLGKHSGAIHVIQHISVLWFHFQR